MAEDHPQFEEVIAVPYRKSGLRRDDVPQDNSGAGRKGKKRDKNAPVAHAKTSKPAGNTTVSNNPFSGIIASQRGPSESDSQNVCPIKETDADGATSKDKHKVKWTPLFTTHGNEIQIKLQGRHPCQCMCTRHDLVNNCLSCGRIVCQQEGSGPCFTCGEFVCTREEGAVLRKGGLDAEKLKRQIYGEDALAVDFSQMLKADSSTTTNSSLEAAEAHKQTLLEYERTAAQRTKVLDDQADYYNENVFMTPDQRKAVREKEKELRAARFQSKLDKNRKFNLDIAGREFKSQSEEVVDMYGEENNPENWIPSSVALNNSAKAPDDNKFVKPNPFVEPFLSFNDELAAIPELPKDLQLKSRTSLRIQDRELQEMSDSGTALSIMQPWASFVVMGLKPHEGRDFYTSHRGKLWIASGMKTLAAGDVIQEENVIKALMGDEFIVFPEQYLHGHILGCVDLVDCITQEEYQQRFPGGLLRYPYIMLVENPQELGRKFPVEGKAKLFRLEYRLHELAKRQVTKKPKKIWRPEITHSKFDS